MSYVEGVDYWVRLVEFPSMASSAVTVSNGDGTFTIYINTRFCPERQAEGLRHELRHLEDEHFYRDEYGICEIEAAANGLLTLSEPAAAEALGGGAGAAEHPALPGRGRSAGGFPPPCLAGVDKTPARGGT